MSRLLALALAALALVLPATADAATVGTTTVYAPATSNDKGVAQIYRFPAQTSGNIDRLGHVFPISRGACRARRG